jgi:hypothetical protein
MIYICVKSDMTKPAHSGPVIRQTLQLRGTPIFLDSGRLTGNSYTIL